MAALGGWLCMAPPRAAAPPTAWLGVRNGHVLAYDAERGQVLLFGGADERQVLGDLWEWDGKRWSLLAAGGPPPRTFASLAYDRDRKRLVLFGGNRVLFGTSADRDTCLGDMWEWYDRAWHQLGIDTPSARAEAAMTYDAARHRLVLFGGYRGAGTGRVRLGDTWEFDGAAWRRMTPSLSPSPRNGAAIAYDGDRRRVVLFGGSGGPNAETWEWDGSSWTRVPAASPGRYNPAMAYDPGSGSVVRFGGWDGKKRKGDTWRYRAGRWEEVPGPGPEPRNHASMAADEARGALVLFGGHDGERVFGDTWEFQAGRWSLVRAVPPRRRVENGH